MIQLRNIILRMIVLLIPSHLVAQKTQIISLSPENFVKYGVSLKSETYKGKSALIVEQENTTDSDRKYTFARLNDFDFHNGIIEVTIAGQPKKDAVEGARGFVGIAFRIPADTSKFELFYIRPTNGRADDQVRRNHSLQYSSHPGYPWRRLRSEAPEKYESYADLIPGEWTKIKIIVQDDKAKLYVNGAEQPNLVVNDLKKGKDLRGSIGLWIAVSTLAQFSDLKITSFD
jgi:hypothetical protein